MRLYEILGEGVGRELARAARYGEVEIKQAIRDIKDRLEDPNIPEKLEMKLRFKLRMMRNLLYREWHAGSGKGLGRPGEVSIG